MLGGILRKIDAKNYHIGGADPPIKILVYRYKSKFHVKTAKTLDITGFVALSDTLIY